MVIRFMSDLGCEQAQPVLMRPHGGAAAEGPFPCRIRPRLLASHRRLRLLTSKPDDSAGDERSAIRALGYSKGAPRSIEVLPQRPPGPVLNYARPLVSDPSGARNEQVFSGELTD